MKCPNCKLVNPPGAMRCDCGYDFTTGQIGAAPGTPGAPTAAKPLRAWVKVLIIFAASVVATAVIDLSGESTYSRSASASTRQKASEVFPVSPQHAGDPVVKAAGFLGQVAVPFLAAMLFAVFVRGQAGVVVGLVIVLFVSVLQWFGRHL